MLDHGYFSSYVKVHGVEPELTFPTGIQAKFMDTDPQGTFDYVFIKGKGVNVTSAERLGGDIHPADNTIYGSDHFAIAVNLEITM